MRKTLLKLMIIAAMTSIYLWPIIPVNAWGGYYTFRSTVAGSGIRQTGTNVYEIVDEKYNFNPNETIYALTRIFNITNVTSFQFKHEIRGNNFYQAGESPVFYPNRHWWQEVYYQFPFNNVPAGNYELVSYIRQDGENYRQLAIKNISVSDRRYNMAGYRDNYNYCQYNNCSQTTRRNNNYNRGRANFTNYTSRYIPDPEYTYDWTKTGTGVRNTSGQIYEITGERTNFTTSDNVYALTKFSNIWNVQKFKVKHEVYRNGSSLVKTDETAEMQPNNSMWKESYIWANLGKLTQGKQEIRVSISVNGGAYKYLYTKSVNVSGNCGYNDSRCYDYKYDWSQTDRNVRQISTYAYETINPKSEFSSNESVVILTKFGSIRGIDRFKVRHELYSNSMLVRTNDSDERRPNYNSWDYNYFSTDFGRLSRGGYSIKVYISINGGGYIYLDTKFITVSDSYYQNNANYDYQGSQTGTIDYNNNNRPINYYN